jgi:pimeloyl-ACP methyl ester carboxylesterase
MLAITEHEVRTLDHRTFYLQCGPADGPLLVFIHGWPELALSWRHVLPCFGSLGFRAVAPDMRGYGRSSAPARHEDYAQEHLVADILALLNALGADKAVFVGHDWGTATVWGLASHHPERCHAVANLCVPYRTLERGLDALIPLVDRAIYPESLHRWGQWAYQAFYHEQFSRATDVFDADPYAAVKALFRGGDPAAVGKPSAHVNVFAAGGWFGGAERAPAMELDGRVITASDAEAYAEALSRNGFFGPSCYYMNDAANLAYSDRSLNNGYLDMPVLFVAARYDITCESIHSRLADPMRAYCKRLSFEVVDSGHWMAQEKPYEVNAILARWLATQVPQAWRAPPPATA